MWRVKYTESFREKKRNFNW